MQGLGRQRVINRERFTHFFGETKIFRDVPEFEAPKEGKSRAAAIEKLRYLSGDKTSLIIPLSAENDIFQY